MVCARCRQPLGTESRFNATFGGLAHWACPTRAVWPPMQGITKRVYSPLIALRKMAMRAEFVDSEAQNHLQALMAIVGKQSLPRSSPLESSHYFSTMETDNHHQQQQTQPSPPSSPIQPLARRPSTTCKRSRSATSTCNQNESTQNVSDSPMEQLEEIVRIHETDPADDTVERKEALQSVEETKNLNISDDSESPQQAVVTPVVSTEESQEEFDEWTTPPGFVEPERDPNSRRGYYLDQAYEARVREQHKAINQALPHWIAHELKRRIKSQAEADRVTSKYCTHLEQHYKERNINNFSFECWVRMLAEKQVSWQGTPDKALRILMDTLCIEHEAKSHLCALLDAPRQKKARR